MKKIYKNQKEKALHDRRTKKGIILSTFWHMKERCQKERILNFTHKNLYEWCIKQKIFHILYDKWVYSNYDRNLKPSIDRKNPLLGYCFKNIRITTYRINIDKGYKEKELLWGKPIIQYDLKNKFIQKFSSIKEAAQKLKINPSLIARVASQQRKSTHGFIFKQNKNIKNNYQKRYLKYTLTKGWKKLNKKQKNKLIELQKARINISRNIKRQQKLIDLNLNYRVHPKQWVKKLKQCEKEIKIFKNLFKK